MTEDELFHHINNSDPKFGSLCEYELMRRLSIKNMESSERFSHSSLYIAIVAILVSLAIGATQIYISTL